MCKILSSHPGLCGGGGWGDTVILCIKEATWWMRVRAETLVGTGTAGTRGLAGESHKVR